MKPKKLYLLLMITTLLGFTICSSQTSQAQETINRQDTFVYAISGEPISMNPLTTSDRWGLTVTNIIFSPLARADAEGNLEMELAENIDQSEDGQTITVTLRPDAKFSDGHPVTAEDVVFTYQQLMDPANGQEAKFMIGDQPISIEQVDDLTVQFVAPQPSGSFLNNIIFENYIIPKHVYQDVEDFSGNCIKGIDPVGSGPYHLDKYNQGQDFRFTANPYYYKGKAHINHLVLRIISNAQTSKAALLSGEIDATLVEPLDVLSIKSDDIDTYPYSEGRVGYIGLNTNNLDDLNFRKAIFYALDREEINRAAYFDGKYYQSAHSILPPSNPYYFKDIEQYNQDLDKAKDYLEQSSLKKDSVSIAYNGESPLEQIIVTMVQEELGKIGLKTELKAMDPAAISAATQDPDNKAFDLFIGGYIMGLDPSAYSVFYTSTGTNNYFNFSTPEIDETFKEGAIEVDPDKRRNIYDQAQAQVMDQAVFFPYVDNKKILAVNQRITGIEEANLVPIYQFGDLSKLSFK